MTTMPEWLGQRAQLSPEGLAMLCPDGRALSFGELYQHAMAACQSLREAGVGKGERVATLMHNGLPFVALLHGAARLGALLVPIHPRLSESETGRRVGSSVASVLVADEENGSLARRIAASNPDVTCLILGDTSTLPFRDETGRPVVLNDIHSLIFTSGSSGPAKRVLLSWGNHFWNAAGSALNLGLREDDRWLACLPFSHVGGMATLLRSVLYGVPVVVHEGFDPDDVNRSLDEDGVTIVSLVGAMLDQVMEARGARAFPPGLRCVLLGGGPSPRSLLAECARRSVPVWSTYGLTEAASQVCTASAKKTAAKPGSVGKPLFPTEIQIRSEGGQVASPGQPGEIVVRGATVTSGYDGDEESTGEALAGGWLHTGDVGYCDADGDLFLVGRKDDLVITGGENVSLTAVEEVILAHPGVAEVGVVGLPDERWGAVVAAAVVLCPDAGTTPEDLEEYCRDSLARHEVPRRLRMVDSLPRSALGKLLRDSLLQEWAQ